MAFKDDIEKEVKRIFRESWSITDATVVPEPSDIALGSNAAKRIAAGTVLYADLSGSTSMVESESSAFAAEIYKTYLYTAATIIRREGGVVTAYDGDRVMAVFIGNSKNSNAARCALKINFTVKNIINPAIKAQYREKTFELKQVVGIDTSPLLVARTGVRGDNDLVWVGRAANYAAKLTELSSSYPTYITGDVFDMLSDASKYGGPSSQIMWTQLRWTQMNDFRIYGSTWWWGI